MGLKAFLRSRSTTAVSSKLGKLVPTESILVFLRGCLIRLIGLKRLMGLNGTAGQPPFACETAKDIRTSCKAEFSHKKGCAKQGAGFYKTVNSDQWSVLKRIVSNCYRIQAIIPGSLIC